MQPNPIVAAFERRQSVEAIQLRRTLTSHLKEIDAELAELKKERREVVEAMRALAARW